jgi:hypothetical protein
MNKNLHPLKMKSFYSWNFRYIPDFKNPPDVLQVVAEVPGLTQVVDTYRLSSWQ